MLPESSICIIHYRALEGFVLFGWVTNKAAAFLAARRAISGQITRVYERARSGTGTREQKCAETSINRGVLRFLGWKSRCGITVPHLRGGNLGSLLPDFSFFSILILH